MENILKAETSLGKPKKIPTKNLIKNNEVVEVVKVEFLKDTKNFIANQTIYGKVGEVKEIPYFAYLVLVKNRKVRKV